MDAYTSLIDRHPFLFNFLSSGPREMHSISKKTLDQDRNLFTHVPTQASENEAHSVTTVSPMNMPNHQPILKGFLLHEHLLTRDFQGDQHFFWKDGSVAAHPTMPGSVSAPNAGDALTQVVPHEDAPAFSDIATTATAAATSPLTMYSHTTPASPISLPQKKSAKEKTKASAKAEPTTYSLTTQVTPYSRGNPVASLSSQGRGLPMDATFTSTVMEKGQVREIAVKNKSSSDHLRSKFPSSSQEQDTSTESPAVITTTTIPTIQTSGEPVYFPLDFHAAEHSNDFVPQIVSTFHVIFFFFLKECQNWEYH